MANEPPFREYIYSDVDDYNQWSLNVSKRPVTWTAIMARVACLGFKERSDAAWTKLDRSRSGYLGFNVYNIAIDGDLYVMQDMKTCFCTVRFNLTACPTAQWMYMSGRKIYTIEFECINPPILNLWPIGT